MTMRRAPALARIILVVVVVVVLDATMLVVAALCSPITAILVVVNVIVARVIIVVIVVIVIIISSGGMTALWWSWLDLMGETPERRLCVGLGIRSNLTNSSFLGEILVFPLPHTYSFSGTSLWCFCNPFNVGIQ